MERDISELKNGEIHVTLSSKRGTGTRDEDKMSVETVYSDIDTALKESWQLNKLVSERLTAARKLSDPPEGTDSQPVFEPEVSSTDGQEAECIEATCPMDWCSYSGDIEQVLGHVMASDDHKQTEQPEIMCPVEGCNRSKAPVGTIAGHFFNKFDGDHDAERLLETGIF